MREEPGALLLAEFTGRLEERRPMEGEGLRETVIVTTFKQVILGEMCR